MSINFDEVQEWLRREQDAATKAKRGGISRGEYGQANERRLVSAPPQVSGVAPVRRRRRRMFTRGPWPSWNLLRPTHAYPKG